MKILQIGYSYRKGAQGIITQSIEKELNKNNIESYVIFCEEGSKSTESAKQCNPYFLSFFSRILNRLFGRKEWHSFLQTKIAIYWIKKFKPDVIHIHIIHHGYYYYKKLFEFLEKLDIKIIFTMHDMWIMTGGCYHFSDIFCKQYQNGCKDCPKKNGIDCLAKETEKNFLLKKSFIENTDIHFVAVSEWVKRIACTGFIKKERIKVIWNGIDTEIFHNIFKEKNNKKYIKIIGVANEWSEAKGLFDIYLLAQKLGKEFIFELIGDCPSKLKKKAPKNIYFVGRIEKKEDLANCYRESDVFIHLSKCETFGMVIAEAACCGVPVIAYRSTGIEEVVNKVQGTLVEIGELDLIVKILNNFKEIKKIKQVPPEIFIKDFSIKKMAENYVNLYKKIWMVKGRR